ncbi:DedA family protein, partial [Xanthomonas perforans]|uniref:YqaA family protein n=1 Tax=Xanthomonas perforans TaxID=442694 RepID=UPI001024F49F
AALQPLIEWLGWSAKIQQQIETLRTLVADSPWKAFWALVLVGFTPIPLKIFTWASGVVGVPILPFIASMLVGRGKRVYLVAGAIRLGGARAEAALHRWIEPLGWVAMAVLAVGAGWVVWKTTNG